MNGKSHTKSQKKILSSTTVFNIHIKIFLKTPNQLIRMISEGSCDTEA